MPTRRPFARTLLAPLFAIALAYAAVASAQTNATPTTPATTATATSADDALRALLGEGFSQPQFLPVDDAFALTIEPDGADRLTARFAVADGYYLYRSKIKFSSDDDGSDDHIRLAEIALPPGSRKVDQYFGEMQVLRESFRAPITVQRRTPAAGALRLRAVYQGCAEGGICYAPVRKDFTVHLPAIIAGAHADDGASSLSSGGDAFAAITDAVAA
ncbi:MAG: protein-disulfide reductase DsbD N-terminal domain-containing protein, partial [bacterium]